MSDAQKISNAQERAQKKAARRAAFIQEIAEAVRVQVCGTQTIQAPFAAAFRRWQASEREADKHMELLGWAKYAGLLPADATELPNAEVQQSLIDAHNRQVAKAA